MIIHFSGTSILDGNILYPIWCPMISQYVIIRVFRRASILIYILRLVLDCGILTSTSCLSTTGWLIFTIFWRGHVFCFLGRLLEALSFLVVAALPLFITEGAWIIFFATSTLSSTFIVGFQDLVTHLYLVNGKLFAILCKFIIFWIWSLISFVHGSEDMTCHPNLFPAIHNGTCNLS
jgi:hypothetical protein